MCFNILVSVIWINTYIPFLFIGGAVAQSGPAIGSDGTIYVGSNDGYLYAVGAPTTACPSSHTISANYTATQMTDICVPSNYNTPVEFELSEPTFLLQLGAPWPKSRRNQYGSSQSPFVGSANNTLKWRFRTGEC